MTTDMKSESWIAGHAEKVFDSDHPQALEQLALKYKDEPIVSVLPDVWVIKIGGQSIMDRGRAAVFPILEELRAARDEGIRFMLGVGGGTRARHVYSLGLDLDLPTAMLAKLGAAVPVQNARMLQMLLAKDGGIMVYPEDFEKLPLYLDVGCIPIISGMPPFEFWEKTPKDSRLPANRTDSGVYLIAEFLAARGVIYIKDEEGLYTDDPKKNPAAKLIPEITAGELLDSDQDDFIIEPVVLQYLQRAKSMREIHIVNGTQPGRVLEALRGNPSGTVIRSG